MIEGILFDMDGILFDTERAYIWAEAEAARQMGVEMGEDYTKQFCGMSSKLVVEILERDYGDRLDVPAYRKLSQQMVLQRVRDEGLVPMPHARETLQWLRDNGYKTAVASSTKTPLVQEFLQTFGFAPFFDEVVGGDQVENGKPNPDIFLLAAQKLGLNADRCVAVEDSYNGIRSAAAAGCVAVMVPDLLPPTDEMREKATAILDDLSQLPKFLKNQK